MLLEKAGAADGGSSPLGKILNSLQSIAATVGAARKEDYALFEMATR